MSNLIKNITEFALYLVQGYISEGDVVVDATCGNGYDTPSAGTAFSCKALCFRYPAGSRRRHKKASL